MSAAPLINLRRILPSEGDLEAMGRRRYQKPNVRKTETKSKSAQQWYFRARIDMRTGPGEIGRVEKTYYLGAVSDIGKREAEKLRDAILDEAINRPAVVIQSQIRFGEILNTFLELAEIRTHTRINYESIFKCHIRPAFGNLRLCDVTPIAVQKWINGLELARLSRKKVIDLFRNVWERAIEWGYTREVCPIRKRLKLPMEAGREKTLPTVQQFRKIHQALAEPYRSMLLVATFTGLRISEIRGLRHSDVKGDVLHVRRSMNQQNEVHETKNEGSVRKVPVGHIAGVFNRPKEADSSDFIFHAPYQTALYHLKAAAKAVGIEYEGFGWHTFRRCSVTWFRQRGGTVQDSMDQHGHATAAMNDLYLIEDDSDLKRRAKAEAEMFDAVMFGGGKGGRA